MACLMAVGLVRPALAQEDVVAVVGGAPITRKELEERLFAYQGAYVLEAMITGRLLSQEARAAGIQVSEEELAAEMSRVREAMGSAEALRDWLLSSRLTEAALKDQVRERLLVEKLLGPRVKITDQELREIYGRNQMNYVQPERVKMVLLTYASEQEAREALAGLGPSRKLADLAATRAKQMGGAALVPIEEYYTRKGLSISPELSQAAFSARLNQVQGPVKSPLGHHIFQVTEKRDAKLPSFEEMKEPIRQRLLKERLYQEALPRWLDQNMNSAKVERKLQWQGEPFSAGWPRMGATAPGTPPQPPR